jgi:hypothetical protein
MRIKTVCKITYPKVIKRLENIIKNNICSTDFNLIQKDGRINSIYDEQYVIRILEDKYGKDFVIVPPNNRNWYDIKLKIKIKKNIAWVPCNIKVSTGGTDNALCKKAIVYSFSNLTDVEIPKCMSFNKMVELIDIHKNKERNLLKEYYYIYVDKKDGTVIIKSLCDIQNYASNAQNWLQINWKKEKLSKITELEEREVSYTRIRSVLRDSLNKFLNTSNKLM